MNSTPTTKWFVMVRGHGVMVIWEVDHFPSQSEAMEKAAKCIENVPGVEYWVAPVCDYSQKL